MSLSRFRILQFVMAICMGIALINAPRPDGVLDKAVWPLAYGIAAVMNLALAISSRRIFLHAWASIIISISLIRATLFGINPTIPAARASTVSANIFLAAMAYLLWGGWKSRLVDGEKIVVALVPVDTAEVLMTPYDETPGQKSLKERLEEHERVNGPLDAAEPKPPQPDSVLEYRLPRVPGLN